jgi:hypothetical protein
VLRELGERAFQDNLASITAQLERGLADLARRFPLSISEVRGRGLMRAIELRKPVWHAGFFLTYLHQQGLSAYLFASVLAQNCGVLVLPTLNDDNVVRIAPPLIALPEHITQLLAALDATLRLWESQSSRQIVLAVMQAVAEQKGRHDPSPHLSPPHPPPLRLPSRRQRASDAAIDYAFLIHPTEVNDLVRNDPTFARFTPREFLAYRAYSAQLPPGIVCEIPAMVSLTGARARGALIGLSLLPEQMIARGRAAVCEAIANAVDLAHGRGARLVGLGAFTSIYTRKGVAVVGRGPSITTGNLLTAGMTFNALQWILERRQMSMTNCRVGIVGARGSVGALVAQLVARARPREMVLIGNPVSGTDSLDRAAARLRSLGLHNHNHCLRTPRARALQRDHFSRARRPTDSRRCSHCSGNHHLRRARAIRHLCRDARTARHHRDRRGWSRCLVTPSVSALAICRAIHPGWRSRAFRKPSCWPSQVPAGLRLGEDLDVSAVDAVLDLARLHGFTLATQALRRTRYPGLEAVRAPRFRRPRASHDEYASLMAAAKNSWRSITLTPSCAPIKRTGNASCACRRAMRHSGSPSRSGTDGSCVIGGHEYGRTWS